MPDFYLQLDTCSRLCAPAVVTAVPTLMPTGDCPLIAIMLVSLVRPSGRHTCGDNVLVAMEVSLCGSLRMLPGSAPAFP